MKCILCGRDNTEVYRVVDNYKITKCLNDGLLYVNPLPSIIEHNNFYSIDYFEREKSASVAQGYRDYLSEQDTFKKNFFRILRKIERIKPTKGRILEVGSAFGFFVECSRLRGWEASGVELNEAVAKWARDRLKVNVFNGTTRSCNFSDNYFDVVCFIGVIEHLLNPLEELEEVRRILKEDGLICITTDNFYARLGGGVFKPPEHLWYFSRETIEKLLVKAGFYNIYVRPYFRFFAHRDFGFQFSQYINKSHNLKLMRFLNRYSTALTHLLKMSKVPIFMYNGQMLVMAKKK